MVRIGGRPARVADKLFDGTRPVAWLIWRLISMPTFEERFVVPPMEREEAVDALFPMLDPVSRNYWRWPNARCKRYGNTRV
jgi:hypothetical protein